MKNTQLMAAKAVKIDEIKRAFKRAAVAPVTDANGVSWHGGQGSALAIDGAVRIAEQAGSTSVTIYDLDGTGHPMPLTEAKNVVLTIGVKYEQDFGKEKTLLRQIKSATAIEEVEAISWLS